jgi:hypothetical protein
MTPTELKKTITSRFDTDLLITTSKTMDRKEIVNVYVINDELIDDVKAYVKGHIRKDIDQQIFIF